MSYLSFHTDRYKINKDQLDQARSSATNASPILEAIHQIVYVIDATVLELLAPRLSVLIKKGIGLPTRAGCGSFVYMLTVTCSNDFRPFSDGILLAFAATLTDRSGISRKSSSTAIGHISKLASASVIESLIMKHRENYLAKTETFDKGVSAVLFLEMYRSAPDSMREFRGLILPLAFMGIRDVSDTATSKLWQEIWDENVAGDTQAIRTLTLEIIELCAVVLQNSSSWTLKKQVGKSLSDVANANGSQIVNYSCKLIAILTESLTGRTWDGKESLLLGLENVCVQGVAYFDTHPETKIDMENLFIRECRKTNNQAYQRHAITAMANVLEALKSERFADICDFLEETAKEDSKNYIEENNHNMPLSILIRSSAFQAIGKVFPRTLENHHLFAENVCSMLVLSLNGQVWNIRCAVLESLASIFNRLLGSEAVLLKNMGNIFEMLLPGLDDMKVISFY